MESLLFSITLSTLEIIFSPNHPHASPGNPPTSPFHSSMSARGPYPFYHLLPCFFTSRLYPLPLKKNPTLPSIAAFLPSPFFSPLYHPGTKPKPLALPAPLPDPCVQARFVLDAGQRRVSESQRGNAPSSIPRSPSRLFPLIATPPALPPLLLNKDVSFRSLPLYKPAVSISTPRCCIETERTYR